MVRKAPHGTCVRLNGVEQRIAQGIVPGQPLLALDGIEFGFKCRLECRV